MQRDLSKRLGQQASVHARWLTQPLSLRVGLLRTCSRRRFLRPARSLRAAAPSLAPADADTLRGVMCVTPFSSLPGFCTIHPDPSSGNEDCDQRGSQP